MANVEATIEPYCHHHLVKCHTWHFKWPLLICLVTCPTLLLWTLSRISSLTTGDFPLSLLFLTKHSLFSSQLIDFSSIWSLFQPQPLPYYQPIVCPLLLISPFLQHVLFHPIKIFFGKQEQASRSVFPSWCLLLSTLLSSSNQSMHLLNSATCCLLSSPDPLGNSRNGFPCDKV